jgi:hypothetical protein
MEIDKNDQIIPSFMQKIGHWKCSKISRIKTDTIDSLITLESPYQNPYII